MCLTVNKGATFKVAQEDITVYKIGLIHDNEYVSKYRGYGYKKGEIQPHVILKTYPLGFQLERQIYEGYHSFTSLKEANIHTREDGSEKIGIFTIPKGSLYIEGTFVGTKNYVSETIIFNGQYKEKRPFRMIINFLKKKLYV